MIGTRRQFLQLAGAAALIGTSAGCATRSETTSSLDAIPRIPLCRLPTALNAMTNLTREIGGPDLYIKRDDVMELAHGGNKTRKLEFALAEALSKGSRAVVTQGGLQSNHVRQTCSGAAKVGLEAHVVLSNPVPEMRDQLTANGNYLMDELMGAHIYHAESGRGPVVEELLKNLENAGKNPYNIPAGASNGIGSLGYVNAAHELIEQWQSMGIQPSHVFTASGSCGTQAGLLMGLRYFGNSTTQVVGVSVSGKAEPMRQRVRKVINEISDVAAIPADIVRDDEIHKHPWLRATLDQLSAEFTSQQPGAELVIDKLTEIVVVELIRINFGRAADSPFVRALSDKQISKALHFLHDELASAWTLESLAGKIGMSRAAFAKRFKELVGQPMFEYLTSLRMQRARELLKETRLPLYEVASRVGYESDLAFTKTFKKHVGTTSTRFRKAESGQTTEPA